MSVGFVESVNGTRVIGWAHDPDGDESRTVVVFKVADRVIAEGDTKVRRLDLLQAGYPEFSGFDVTLDLPTGDHTIAVATKVSGYELMNSPFVCKVSDASIIRHKFELLGRLGIRGWAYHPLKTAERLRLIVFFDDIPFATIKADRDCSDPATAGAAYCGFDWPAPIANVLSCRTVSVKDEATGHWLVHRKALCPVLFHLETERTGADLMRGWAVNCENHRLRPALRVKRADVELGKFRPTLFRPDLEENGIGDGFHGFVEEVTWENGLVDLEIIDERSGVRVFSTRGDRPVA